MAKICVTGANGFLGSWLVRHLVQRGHELRVIARPTSDLSELEGSKYELVHGDILDPESLRRAFLDQDSVFHLAGLVAYKAKDREKMEAVNVGGTENVLAACEARKIRRLLHTSSVVAVGAGFSPDEILNENSAYNVGHLNLGYFETKRKAELKVLEWVKAGRGDAVIVNPATVYGPGDAKKGSRKVQLKVAHGTLPFYPGGGVNIVGVDACVEGMIAAWEKGRTGERYILAGENLLIRDVFKIIAECAGVPAPKYRLPTGLLRALGGVGDLLSDWGLSTPVSSETVWTSTLYHWFDSSKAQRELGFSPGSAKAAIETSVKWIKENGL